MRHPQSSTKPSTASLYALSFRWLSYSSYGPGIFIHGQWLAILVVRSRPLIAWVLFLWSQLGSWPITVDKFPGSSKLALGP